MVPSAIPEEGTRVAGCYLLSVRIIAGIILGNHAKITTTLHINVPTHILTAVPVLASNEHRIARLVGIIAPKGDAEVCGATVGYGAELQFRWIAQRHVVVDGIGAINRERNAIAELTGAGSGRTDRHAFDPVGHCVGVVTGYVLAVKRHVKDEAIRDLGLTDTDTEAKGHSSR